MSPEIQSAHWEKDLNPRQISGAELNKYLSDLKMDKYDSHTGEISSLYRERILDLAHKARGKSRSGRMMHFPKIQTQDDAHKLWVKLLQQDPYDTRIILEEYAHSLAENKDKSEVEETVQGVRGKVNKTLQEKEDRRQKGWKATKKAVLRGDVIFDK